MSDVEELVVVNHVGLCTADLARSRRFYEELLGFTVERELKVPDEAAAALLCIDPPVNLTAVYLRRGAFVLELLHFDRPRNPGRRERAMNEPGLTHMSVAVEHLDGVVARVPELGGEVITQLPGAVLVRDPDGQLVELLPMAYHRRVEQQRDARQRET
jgi:lactoylglutathione lyase